MMSPKTMCRPPNPAAMNASPHAGGVSSAAAPMSMKHTPITGTTRTENVPAVTTPAPYSSSQSAGIISSAPAADSANVSTTPAATGGRKLRKNLRLGPDCSGSPARFAFAATAHPAIPTDTTASAIHTASHRTVPGCSDATTAATSAVSPSSTPPHPGTAVHDPARSTVWRMKRRSSIARASSDTGSEVRSLRDGAGIMDEILLQDAGHCQVLCNTKNAGVELAGLAADFVGGGCGGGGGWGSDSRVSRFGSRLRIRL